MAKTPVVILILAAADGQPCPLAGRYVRDFNPDDFGGRGRVETTADPAEAKSFADAAEAMAFWRQRSPKYPRRADGEANRPLTAYTCSIGPPPNLTRR